MVNHYSEVIFKKLEISTKIIYFYKYFTFKLAKTFENTFLYCFSFRILNLNIELIE